MKRLDVCGMGNGLVDILVRVSDKEFESLGFERATTRMTDSAEQAAVLEQLKHHDALVASGGSVANSVIAVAQLGGKAAYMGCLGDDRYGTHFEGELESLGVEIANHLIASQSTGTVACLITPDGERTMRFNLGVAAHLSPDYVNEAVIAQSKWLFVEGFLFSNPGKGQDAIRHAVDLARRHGCKIAVTFSESWVVNTFGDALREIVQQSDLVFANEAEACTFTGAADAKAAFQKLSAQIPSVVVTAGPAGAFVSHEGSQQHIPAFPCNPVDLTGAGDMLAGAFLYGLTNGFSAKDAARAGCFLCREVITRVGPRLSSGTRDYWEQALAAA